MPAVPFADRRDAGRRLAARLAEFAAERPVVVALPRGGVPVGFEIARALDAPLDVIVARKVGAPDNPEYGIGAIAEGGVRYVNDAAVQALQIRLDELDDALARARYELDARVRRYRAERPRIDVAGRTVILVDDGLATGGTARAAARALRARRPRRLVLATPVGASDSIAALEPEVDAVVCLLVPRFMRAIGRWYDDFGQTSDGEVAALLARAATDATARRTRAEPARREEVRLPIDGGGHVAGELAVPRDAAGVIVFAHGSGSSRRSARNRRVAAGLHGAGMATLLLDLLTPAEERLQANVFDVELLAGRLVAATRWLAEQPRLSRLAVGYFGASTGAGAALWAAAELGERIRAVVSRGGRPDLAVPRLAEVRAPTLLIVGGDDERVLALNRAALDELRCEAALEIVPGATHLFEEPGALEAVQRLAAGWFATHLARLPAGRAR